MFPLGLLEQFVQIGNAGPAGVDAGDLVSKGDKQLLVEMGLVTPAYGTGFHLTEAGSRVWQEVRRIISYTDPWQVSAPSSGGEGG